MAKFAKLQTPPEVATETVCRVTGVQVGSEYVQFGHPVNVAVRADPETGFWIALDPDLGIDAYSKDVSEIQGQVAFQLAMNIERLSDASTKRLSQGALRLNQNLQRLVGR
jgi:hypothetical protein